MTHPSVSVVIPVKDDSTELARCLVALRAQSRLPDEIIVVDNDSSDDSAAVALRAGVTLVRCDDPGISAAAARGYDQAGCDLILRLDADCVPDPAWIQTMVEAFDRRADVAVYTGAARFTDGPPSLRGPLAAAYLGAYALATAPALGHAPLFGSNLAMRSDAWRSVRSEVHRHDADIHDDLDLAFHLGERHRIGVLRGAPMGISIRPFQSGRQFAVRTYRGFRTVAVHWPRDFPPVRWLRRAVRGRMVPPPSAPADGS